MDPAGSGPSAAERKQRQARRPPSGSNDHSPLIAELLALRDARQWSKLIDAVSRIETPRAQDQLDILRLHAEAASRQAIWALAAEKWSQVCEGGKEPTARELAHWGQALRLVHQLDQARAVLERALATDANDTLALIQLAKLHTRLRNWPVALEYWERVVSLGAAKKAEDIEAIERCRSKLRPEGRGTKGSGAENTAKLKRIIFLVFDISVVGGISGRIRKVLEASADRDIDYVCISKYNTRSYSSPRLHVIQDDGRSLAEYLSACSPADTVVVTANNIMKSMGRNAEQLLEQFPIIFMFSGQMAFFVQDSTVLADVDYVDRLRVSAIIALSDMDIAFQRQLGIHHQVKGFLPVDVRVANTYSVTKNTRVSYVGRIDFHAKAVDRLLDVAAEMKVRAMAPLRIFTTDGRNSPDYQSFRDSIAAQGLETQFEFVLECTDKGVIYDEVSVLLLPSKKESFGNVILEAYSYGVPVIAAAYAPGPSELIVDGETGYLVDSFDGPSVVSLLETLDKDKLLRLSSGAFERHKLYAMDRHFDFLERLSRAVVGKFDGKNQLPVFPRLKAITDAIRPKPSRSAGETHSAVPQSQVVAARLPSRSAYLAASARLQAIRRKIMELESQRPLIEVR